MNIRSRVITILIVVGIGLMLIWPNIGERSIRVYLLPNLTADEKQASFAALGDFIQKNYANKYRFQKSQTTVEEYKLIAEADFLKKKNKIKKREYSQEELEEKYKALEDEKKKSIESFQPEQFFEIKGSFIQTAFINELSRIKGVDGQRILFDKMWVEENLNASSFKLGLDLQGGMNLLLKGDFDKFIADMKKQYPPSKVAELKAQYEKETDKTKKEEIKANLDRIEDALTLTEEKKAIYIQGALEIIRSRVDKTGVSEPLLRVQDNDKIEISLPGVASPEQAKKLIKSTAKVSYHLGETDTSANSFTAKANALFPKFAELTSDAQRSEMIQKIIAEIKLPEKLDLLVYWDKSGTEDDNKLVPQSFMVVEREASLSGEDISPNVYAGYDSERLMNTVNFQLTSDGTQKFADLTTKNKNRQLAIVIDDKIRSAPSINDPILGGQAQISGNFTPQEAQDLALIIKEGSLPVPLDIVQENSIGPSLGKEAVEKGIMAVVLGLILVVLFMVLYYQVAGVIAVFGLAVNLLLMGALLALMNFTVTLPGLAGIILTMGMAVDGNVIIYERIKEELMRGKSMKMALSQGFERATLAIVDGNLTTLIAAVVLSQFGVGPIKGFAVTLFIGILTTLFSALFVTRTLMAVLVIQWNFKYVPMGWGKYGKIIHGKLAPRQ